MASCGRNVKFTNVLKRIVCHFGKWMRRLIQVKTLRESEAATNLICQSFYFFSFSPLL